MSITGSILPTAIGYILKAAAQSKTAENAKEEVLGKFWKWIKPYFIKDIPQIEEKADDPETITKTNERIKELVKDDIFLKELTAQIEVLKHAQINNAMVKGNGNFTIQGINNSSISIN
jgi:hypothetical protein